MGRAKQMTETVSEQLGYVNKEDLKKKFGDKLGYLPDVPPIPGGWQVVNGVLAYKQGVDAIGHWLMVLVKSLFIPMSALFMNSPLGKIPVLRNAFPDLMRDFLLLKSGALRGGILASEIAEGEDQDASDVAGATSRAGKFAEGAKRIGFGVGSVVGKLRNAAEGLAEKFNNSGLGKMVAGDYRDTVQNKPEFYATSRARSSAQQLVQNEGPMRGDQYPYGMSRKPYDLGEQPRDTSNEPQLLLAHKSPSIVDTNITNSNDFSCWQTAETTPVRKTAHPFFRFDRPLHKVHVHAEDLTNHDVKWDAIYNLQGSTVLKPNATALGGTRPDFWTFCAPPDDPPHTFSVDVHLVGTGFNKLDKYRSFLGSTLVNAFTPLHAPESYGMPMPTRPDSFKINIVGNLLKSQRQNQEWETIQL